MNKAGLSSLAGGSLKLPQAPRRGIWQCHSKVKVSFPPSPGVPPLPEGLGPWGPGAPGAALSSSTSDGVAALPHKPPSVLEQTPIPLHGLKALISLPLGPPAPLFLPPNPVGITTPVLPTSLFPRFRPLLCHPLSLECYSILYLLKPGSPFKTSPRWHLPEDPLQSPSQSLSSVQWVTRTTD